MQEVVWGLLDYTDNKMKGYLRVQRNGVRIADLFPYAPDADPAFLREQAERIVEAMNRDERAIEEQRQADIFNEQVANGLSSESL